MLSSQWQGEQQSPWRPTGNDFPVYWVVHVPHVHHKIYSTCRHPLASGASMVAACSRLVLFIRYVLKFYGTSSCKRVARLGSAQYAYVVAFIRIDARDVVNEPWPRAPPTVSPTLVFLCSRWSCCLCHQDLPCYSENCG